MKRKSLLFLMLMAMFAPLAMNAQTQRLRKNVTRAPRTQLQLEVAGQLQTIEDFQPGVIYNRAAVNNRDNVLYSENFDGETLEGISIADNDEDGNNWGWYGSIGVDGTDALASQSWDETAGALTPDNWVIFPAVTLPTSGSCFASVYAKNYNASYPETMGIWVAPENDDYIYRLGDDFTLTSGSFVNCEADLSAYAGQTVQVVIRHYNCTDGTYLVIDDFSVTSVTNECGAPYDLTVNDITANTAELSWAGNQDSYNVHYRSYTLGEPQENVFEEGFEGGSMPTGWTTTGSYWKITSGTGNSSYTGSATGNYNAGCYISSYSGSDILITPAIDLSQATSATLTFNFWNTSWGGDINTLNVYYRVDGGNWSNALYTNNSQVTPWTSISVTLPSSGFAANYQIGFECVSNYSYGMGIDDVKITYTAPSINYGEWVTKTNVTSPLNINDLTPTIENDNHYLPTNYQWQVQGIDCDGNGGTTDWSAPATFTTLEGYVLHITGYANNGGYYLIASPIGDVNPVNVTNMIDNTPGADGKYNYDLYRFDQNPSDGLEWRNYRKGAFNLNIGQGYLYAHRTDVDLVFTGSAISGSNYAVPLTKSASASGHEFPDWNLVGNPFADVAHFANNHPFYTLDVSGAYTLVSDASSTIESMQGVFVVAGENEESITFVKGEPSKKSPKVTLNVSKGTEVGVIDRAIVCFGETRQMPKFQLFKNSTKVYIPMEGKDYALVRGEEMGAMPVNFKAEENGTYSMNFSCENVGFAYLHLIDNKTGNDVDLLKTPSYSFEAKTTDYESRFKLVFATGDNSNDDNFAFFSNGSFVINNDGAAELQVIDLMGRILSSETINGCTNVNVNAAPGVYMLRLVNGDNVKVQKVVVK